MSDRSTRYRATWNGAVIAESDDVVLLEGNVYFPPEALVDEHFDAIQGPVPLPVEGHRPVLRHRRRRLRQPQRRLDLSPPHAPRSPHQAARFWQGVQVGAVR